ncbi:DUF1345 domain-containing protein [Agriterribacter sp.]|uniref:DUF1345 domain-containing protein n=1 Tax=Agriterribacter sp. TaxID=2821509 RepID=UPI002C0233DD|nr:DUF1345 domain-containing protein [Agriterribacter sp.]HRO46666.1 DUF1345 domain-containing protein [Agriterribacter sp.]HRQ17327.1 DUF1345 domain-containing protein [Agriterribacter sp.]
MNDTADKKNLSWFNRLHIAYKIMICAVIATGLSWLIPFPHTHLAALSHIMLGWDGFCFLLLLFYWHSFFTTPQLHIRKQAAKEDPSRTVIFFIILISTFVSMLAVILLLTTKKQEPVAKELHLPIAITAMILSWALVHTVFAVRYAHLYYSNHISHSQTHAGGMDFPEEDKPDFLDFAYFSFVLGMTFQVSDVSVTSKKIRRWALWHGLIAFGYNTVIVALTINIIAGLGE